jgi:hypothetical protein
MIPFRRRLAPAFAALVVTAAPILAHAQSVYAGLGTTGLTVGAGHVWTDLVGTRAELSLLPTTTRSFTEDGIDYRGEARSVRGAALLDWFPMRGGFRVTVGLSANDSRGDFTGSPSTGSTLDIGDATVAVGPADSYTVRVALPSAMPYLGIGWGHSPARGWGFHADLGLLIGKPKVTGALSPSLSAKIAAAGLDPQTELDRELQSVSDSIADVDAYPVVSIGVSYRW